MSQVKLPCRPWETEKAPRCGNCKNYNAKQDTEGNCGETSGRVRAIALAFPKVKDGEDKRNNRPCYNWKPTLKHLRLLHQKVVA